MSLEVKIGGLNASLGATQNLSSAQETMKGSVRRATIKAQIQHLPPELRPFLNELLDWVVFRDEIQYLV